MSTDRSRRSDTQEAVEGLRQEAPELATLFDAIRAEFDAKVSAAKAWGFAMCVTAGAFGGLATSLAQVTGHGVSVSEAVSALTHML